MVSHHINLTLNCFSQDSNLFACNRIQDLLKVVNENWDTMVLRKASVEFWEPTYIYIRIDFTNFIKFVYVLNFLDR